LRASKTLIRLGLPRHRSARRHRVFRGIWIACDDGPRVNLLRRRHSGHRVCLASLPRASSTADWRCRMNRSALFAIAFPLAVMGAWLARLDWLERSGTPVQLAVTGFDPRDLLAGHYLTYTVG